METKIYLKEEFKHGKKIIDKHVVLVKVDKADIYLINSNQCEILKDITEINEGAFYSCTGLRNITFSEK